jgi:outer membrane protein assembly factor BamB
MESLTGIIQVSKPTLSNDGTIVFASSGDNNMYALNSEHNGTLLWKYAIGRVGGMLGAAAIAESGPTKGTLYVGSGDGNMYALEC